MVRRYIYPQADTPHILENMLAWAVARMKATADPDFCKFRSDATAIGHEIGETLVAVIVYDTFGSGDCHFHVAADNSHRWLTREFILRGVAYPFLQVGQRRVTATVSEHNEPSLRITRHFGFVEEGRLREAGKHGEDVILFGLTRQECRWLPENGFRFSKKTEH